MTDESKREQIGAKSESSDYPSANLALDSPLTSPDFVSSDEISDAGVGAAENKPAKIFGTGELKAYQDDEPKLGVYIRALDGAVGEERTFLKAAATDMLIAQATTKAVPVAAKEVLTAGVAVSSDTSEKHSHHERHEAASHHERHALKKKHSDFIQEIDVSKSFSKDAQTWIHSVPGEHRRVMENKGYHYILVKDIKVYDKKFHTKLATEQPEGYPPGWTGEATGAFYDPVRKNIVLCERFKVGTAPEADTTKYLAMAGRTRHESAHALDEARAFKLQHSPEMIKAYDAVLKTLSASPVTRNNIGYYLQPNEVNARGQVVSRPGLREAIAELYAIKHGGGTDYPWKDKSLKDAFGDMLKIMTRKGY